MAVDKAAEHHRILRALASELTQQGKIPRQKVGRHSRFRGKGGSWAESELSNTSASLMSTTRFRPENLLLQAAVGLLAILTFTVGTAAISLLGAGTADLLGNLLPNFGR